MKGSVEASGAAQRQLGSSASQHTVADLAVWDGAIGLATTGMYGSGVLTSGGGGNLIVESNPLYNLYYRWWRGQPYSEWGQWGAESPVVQLWTCVPLVVTEAQPHLCWLMGPVAQIPGWHGGVACTLQQCRFIGNYLGWGCLVNRGTSKFIRIQEALDFTFLICIQM